MTPALEWVVFACRTAYTADVVEIIWRTGGSIAGLVDNLADGEAGDSPLGPVFGRERSDELIDRPTVVPLLTPGFRHAVVTEATAAGFRDFPALVDPTSVIARTSTIGEGSVINAAVVVAATTSIGRYVQVNRSASVGHDNRLADFSTIGPGCVLAGSVTVGRGAFLGAGVVCAPNVVIGMNSIVGAGAVVVRDIEDGVVAVGNPARAIRSTPGYGEVGVPVA